MLFLHIGPMIPSRLKKHKNLFIFFDEEDGKHGKIVEINKKQSWASWHDFQLCYNLPGQKIRRTFDVFESIAPHWLLNYKIRADKMEFDKAYEIDGRRFLSRGLSKSGIPIISDLDEENLDTMEPGAMVEEVYD